RCVGYASRFPQISSPPRASLALLAPSLPAPSADRVFHAKTAPAPSIRRVFRRTNPHPHASPHPQSGTMLHSFFAAPSATFPHGRLPKVSWFLPPNPPDALRSVQKILATLASAANNETPPG